MEQVLKTILIISLQITISMLMVSLGLETTHRDLLQLWRRPRLLLCSLLAAFLAVPLAAYLTFRILPLSFEAKVGLWVVAITPGAPMIYRAAIKRGLGNWGLAASFQVTVALLVIVMAPLWLAIVNAITRSHYLIPFFVIAKQVSSVQFIPILLGLAINRLSPHRARSIAQILIRIGNIALIALVVILLLVLGPRMIASIEPWRVLGAILIATAAILSGHYLAGPNPEDRIPIANANVQRNPGLALVIAAWNLPHQRGETIVVVATYMVIGLAIAAIYTRIAAGAIRS